MATDFLLAAWHHAAVFSLVGIFAAEFALVRPGLTAARAKGLARLDAFYGLAALLAIAAGVARILWGAKGWAAYEHNHAFYAKMACFALVAALSLPPTLQFQKWRKLENDPPEAEVKRVRGFIHAQAAFLALIPVFAAMMARFGS